MQYPCRIRKTYLGEFEVTFPDFPSFVQYYSSEQQALDSVSMDLVEAMAKSIAMNQKVPEPSRQTSGELLVKVDVQTMQQIQLYNQNIIQ
jgi:hypothetical protein